MAQVKETKSKTKKAKEAKEAEVIAEAVVETSVQPALDVELVETDIEMPTAKAGKRSSKAIKESEEKQTKVTRKAETSEDTGKSKAKAAKKPTRSKAERAGKKYREAHKLVEKDKTYSLADALELATKTSPTKFDGTVELHINLGVDPRQADQNVRGTVSLPAGTGKTVRVAVMADAEDTAKAKSAGADIAGSDELMAQLDKEQVDFDILISTPALMARLGKYAKFLGPRGLMPNPKSGTVTTDIATAVKEARAGKVEFRVDQAGIIHLGIGKVSFGAAKLGENANAVIAGVKTAKPASLKNIYIKSAYISTTMGPSIKFSL